MRISSGACLTVQNLHSITNIFASIIIQEIAMRSKDILKFLTVILLCHYGNGLRAQDAKPITFDDHIAPIFKRHCVQCHGETKQKAGLDLSSYLSTKKGGGGGPVAVSYTHLTLPTICSV